MDAHEAARAPALSEFIEQSVIAAMTALAADGRFSSAAKLARRGDNDIASWCDATMDLFWVSCRSIEQSRSPQMPLDEGS